MVNNKILICIFNYRHDDNAKLLLKNIGPYFKTIVLDSGNDHEEKEFIQYPNIYYSGLWNEMKKLSCDNYDFIGFITSDIKFSQDDYKKLIDRLNWLLTTTNIGIWQPALITDSWYAWPHYDFNRNHKLFESNLLEGMMHIIKKDVLDSIDFIDINENLYGWGLDIETSLKSTDLGYLNIVDNNVNMYHPQHTGYDSNKANEQGNIYLKRLRNKTCQQVVNSHYIKPINDWKIKYKNNFLIK